MTTQLDIIAQNRWENQQAFKEGQAEGLERGLEQGKEEQSRIIARSLLDRGMHASEVADITGLSLEAVSSL